MTDEQEEELGNKYLEKEKYAGVDEARKAMEAQKRHYEFVERYMGNKLRNEDFYWQNKKEATEAEQKKALEEKMKSLNKYNAMRKKARQIRERIAREKAAEA